MPLPENKRTGQVLSCGKCHAVCEAIIGKIKKDINSDGACIGYGVFLYCNEGHFLALDVTASVPAYLLKN